MLPVAADLWIMNRGIFMQSGKANCFTSFFVGKIEKIIVVFLSIQSYTYDCKRLHFPVEQLRTIG